MTLTFASLFTGGGGADLGAIAAGLKPIWGIEKDPVITDLTRSNFHDHKIIIGDVGNFDYSLFKTPYNSPDWLHASPPCVRASTANNGKESAEDMELAEAICRAIAILKPKYFSLENVAGYKNFNAFLLIEKRLLELGYTYDYKVLDCADYGIPQSRKRLFLVASARNCRSTFFFWERLKKQEPVGWHEAIADLIPTLPECKLTKSQKERLDKSVLVGFSTMAIQNAGNRKKDGQQNHIIRLADYPIWTIKAMSGNVRVNPHQATLIIDGKVLRPSIECYARWQTFPDSYQWSDDFKLNVKICGNAVPLLMMKQIIEAVIHA